MLTDEQAAEYAKLYATTVSDRELIAKALREGHADKISGPSPTEADELNYNTYDGRDGFWKRFIVTCKAFFSGELL